MMDIVIYENGLCQEGAQRRGRAVSFKGTAQTKSQLDELYRVMLTGSGVLEQVKAQQEKYGELAAIFIRQFAFMEEQFNQIRQTVTERGDIDSQRITHLLTEGKLFGTIVEAQTTIMNENIEQLRNLASQSSTQIYETQRVVESQDVIIKSMLAQLQQLAQSTETAQAAAERAQRSADQANSVLERAMREQASLAQKEAEFVASVKSLERDQARQLQFHQRIEKEIQKLASGKRGTLAENWLMEFLQGLPSDSSDPSQSGTRTPIPRGNQEPPAEDVPPLPPSPMEDHSGEDPSGPPAPPANRNRNPPDDPGSSSDSESEPEYLRQPPWSSRQKHRPNLPVRNPARETREMQVLRVIDRPQMKAPKAFSGKKNELESFLLQLEQYFSYNSISFSDDKTKVTWFQSVLEGDALRWYTFRQKQKRALEEEDTWAQLLKAFRIKYQQEDVEVEKEEEMRKLKYKDDIGKYLMELEELNYYVNMTGTPYRNLVLRAMPDDVLRLYGAPEIQDDGDFEAKIRFAARTYERIQNRQKILKDSKTTSSSTNRSNREERPTTQSKKPWESKSSDGSFRSMRHTNWTAAHAGISQAVVDMRREKKACTRCGLAAKADGTQHHTWKDCRRNISLTGVTKPYTQEAGNRKVAGAKRRAEEEEAEPSEESEKEEEPTPPPKKVKKAIVATAKQAEVTQGRVYEVEDDEDMADFQ